MKPKSQQEIVDIRESGRITAAVLKYLAQNVSPGMTTDELDRLAMSELKRLGGKPAFLGYQDYPKSVCVSVNHQVVHGIPGDTVLEDGDVVGLDYGVNYNGMITDSALTLAVGRAGKSVERLINATEEAMYAGIDKVKAGARVGDISAAIQVVLEREGLGIVRDLAGHGVGHSLHEDPWVPNFGSTGKGSALQAGMTIAIEPMATLGGDDVIFEADGWTVSTEDGSLAAHFEHTVLVTDEGYEILTAR